VTWRLGAAVTIALTATGCGGGGDSGGGSSPPKGRDVAIAAGRVETPSLILQIGRRPARHRIELDGKRYAARRGWLLPVEVKLTNRRKRKLAVGQMSADVVNGGTRYSPIYADGRSAAAPIFTETSVPAGAAANTLLLYRLPRRTLPKASIRVLDPARGATYNLRLF
jgi:hypothetical protein